MVLLKTTLAGATMLVVGILLLTLLSQYVTVQVQYTQTRTVEPHAEFLVGDVVDRQYTLPASVSAAGTVDVTQAPSNASGNVQFTIFDDSNYQKWNSGQQSNSLYSSEGQGQFNYTFSTGGAGLYHFIFDNRASLYKKYVVLSVNYDEIILTHVPDSRIPYIGYVLLVGGAIVLVFGLLKKPPVSWA